MPLILILGNYSESNVAFFGVGIKKTVHFNLFFKKII